MFKIKDRSFTTKDDINEYLMDIKISNFRYPSLYYQMQRSFWDRKQQEISDKEYIDFLTELFNIGPYKDQYETPSKFAVNRKADVIRFEMFTKLKDPDNIYRELWHPFSTKKCIDVLKTDRDEFYFTFGKHKGKYISEVNDDNYLSWILTSDLHERIKDPVYNYLKAKQDGQNSN